jgi:putative ABC transport system permease protein
MVPTCVNNSMISFWQTLRIVVQSIASSKLRFFLTVLGIVIGVASVILVSSIGSSAQGLIISQVENVGSNLITILPGASDEKGPPAFAFGIITKTLTIDDMEAVKKNVPNVVAVTGYVNGSATLESATESIGGSFQGVSPTLPDTENVSLAAGQFFGTSDSGSSVAVIGYKLMSLYPGLTTDEIVGEKITIKNRPFTIIGVLAEKGNSAFADPDSTVYVPLVVAQQQLLGIRYLTFFRAKVDTAENLFVAKEDVKNLLKRRHSISDREEPDFSVRTLDSAVDLLRTVTNAVKYFLIAVAGIALLVGGIGIMNSMLIAVNQRIREIGLRKALGATAAALRNQFLFESIVVTLFGGVIGLAVGAFLVWIISLVVPRLGYVWKFSLPLDSVFISIGVCTLIGLVFGLYPARKASKVSPIEALRYE